jgi:hypothetical protein
MGMKACSEDLRERVIRAVATPEVTHLKYRVVKQAS